LWTEQDAYNEALKKSGDLSTIYADAATQAQTLQSALNRIAAVTLKIADSAMAQVLKDFSKQIEKLANDPNLPKFIDWATKAAVAITGLWVAMNAFKMAKGLVALGGAIGSIVMPGKGAPGAGGGLGGLLGPGGSPANPMYVVIVGGGGGGIPGVPGAGGGAAKGIVAGAAAALNTPFIAAALPIAGMVGAGYFAHEQYMKTALAEKAAREDAASKRAYQYADLGQTEFNVTNIIDGEQIAGHITKKQMKLPRGYQLNILGVNQ
jgi:hypothetical protein